MGRAHLPRPRSRAGTALVLAASALSTLPVWLTTFPPMVDYPQHLAMAAMLRWWDDPERGFADTYRLVWTAPQSLFEWLAAGAAWLVPIEQAGKLAVALALAAVGPAALALAHRLGRPAWYALPPLAMAYNYAYSWGFVGTLFAYPLFLAGLAAADRLLDRLERDPERPAGGFGPAAWLALAGLTLAFYLVHLQLLLLFAAAVAWLAAARRPGRRRAAVPLSALLPGVLLVLALVLLPNLLSVETSFSPYEQSMKAAGTRLRPLPVKLLLLPALTFGARPRLGEMIPAGLVLGLAGTVLVGAWRRRERKDQVGEARAGRLFRWRFPALSLGLFALYLVLPERTMGYLVAERLAPLAAMLAVVALPQPGRAFVPKALAGGLLTLQLGLLSADSLRFERDAAGLSPLLRSAAPGRPLAGLVFDPYPDAPPALLRYPIYTHFPALYQALRGGRVLFSFAELSHSVVQYRAGRGWPPELLARVADRNPRAFSLPNDGPLFDYLLVRGDWPSIQPTLGPALSAWQLRSTGRWHLLRNSRPTPACSPRWTFVPPSGTLPALLRGRPPGRPAPPRGRPSWRRRCFTGRGEGRKIARFARRTARCARRVSFGS